MQSWHLEYFLDSTQHETNSALKRMQLITLLGGVILILAILAWFAHYELRRALREAAQRITFVNQVSHELRTPLTNIRLYAEMLHDELEENPAHQRRTRIIISESGRLSRLIANVLSFSRHQRHQLMIHPRPLEIDTLIKNLLDQFGPALAHQGIKIETAFDAPESIRADADAIAQIIGNLISNVEKYAAQGKKLTLTTAQGNGNTLVEIKDAGPGIPRRQSQRIFRPFFRVRNNLTEGVSGAGLGLSIAKELAELHHGSLQLINSSTEAAVTGCRFRLTLPNAGPK